MRFLRKLAAMFAADRLVLLTVPTASVLAWLAVPWLPRAVVALVLLALLAGSFSLGVLRSSRSRSET